MPAFKIILPLVSSKEAIGINLDPMARGENALNLVIQNPSDYLNSNLELILDARLGSLSHSSETSRITEDAESGLETMSMKRILHVVKQQVTPVRDSIKWERVEWFLDMLWWKQFPKESRILFEFKEPKDIESFTVHSDKPFGGTDWQIDSC